MAKDANWRKRNIRFRCLGVRRIFGYLTRQRFSWVRQLRHEAHSPRLFLSKRMLALVVASALFGVACKAKEKGARAQKKKAKEDGVDVALSPTALEAAGISVIKVKSEPRRSSVTAAGVIDFAPGRVAHWPDNLHGARCECSCHSRTKPPKARRWSHWRAWTLGVRGLTEQRRSRGQTSRCRACARREIGGRRRRFREKLQVARTEKRVAESELRAAEARLGTLGVGTGLVRGLRLFLSPRHLLGLCLK